MFVLISTKFSCSFNEIRKYSIYLFLFLLILKRCRPALNFDNQQARYKRAKLEMYDQRFCWPYSFPQCTQQLSMCILSVMSLQYKISFF
jgi:hypothetical protein